MYGEVEAVGAGWPQTICSILTLISTLFLLAGSILIAIERVCGVSVDNGEQRVERVTGDGEQQVRL